MAKKNYESQRDDYMTPPDIYKPLLELAQREKFDIDVCCSEKNIPAVKHLLANETNGLYEDWRGVCFMNPPFNKAKDWVTKAYMERPLLDGTVIYAVLPADRLETKYMQECVLNNEFCLFAFLPGKQGFYVPGDIFGECIPSQKIMIVIFSRSHIVLGNIAMAWQDKKLFNTQIFMGGHF